jgi:hypothetical protein
MKNVGGGSKATLNWHGSCSKLGKPRIRRAQPKQKQIGCGSGSRSKLACSFGNIGLLDLATPSGSKLAWVLQQQQQQRQRRRQVHAGSTRKMAAIGLITHRRPALAWIAH